MYLEEREVSETESVRKSIIKGNDSVKERKVSEMSNNRKVAKEIENVINIFN